MFVLLPTSESASNFLFENLLIIEIITWIGKKNKEIIFLFRNDYIYFRMGKFNYESDHLFFHESNHQSYVSQVVQIF